MQIDPGLRALIPPLQPDELAQLEANLLAEGCRDPLVTWRGVLLDGHHRHEICTRLNIPFEVLELELPDRNAAIAWIAANQLGRRNLTPFARSELALVLKAALAEQARERQVATQFGSTVRLNSDAPGRTDTALAKMAGVGRDTIRKTESVLNTAPPHVIEAARNGELSIHRAYCLTTALLDSGPRTQALAEKHAIDNPELVTFLAEGEAGGNEWFAEVEASGYVQPQEEDSAVSITAGVAALQRAITERARLHRSIAADAKRVHVANNTGEFEWYTPPLILDAARQVLGAFDLDPASCALANKTVCATTYYDIEANGLSKPWVGRVWLNPPYSQPLVAQFVNKLLSHWQAGDITACLLVNNATDTAFLQAALSECTSACFLRGRVRFIDAQGNPNGAPLQGQVVLYFGPSRAEFYRAFAPLGVVLEAYRD